MGLNFVNADTRLKLTLPKKALSLLIATLLFSTTQAAHADISGYVFRDYNANGQRDESATFKEPYMGGVTVTAYPSSGSAQTTVSAQGTGAYSFTGLSLPARLEFSGLDIGDYSVQGSGSASSVQFYTASTTNANFGITSPDTYYTDASQPVLFSSLMSNGDQTAGNKALISLPYAASGNDWYAQVSEEGLDSQVGSIYGIAYQKSTQRIFASAYLKRHVGLGTAGLDAIYVTTPGSKNPQVFVNLKADLGIDVGTVGTNSARQLAAAKDPNYDIEGYNKVGKVGIGDIDISQDDQTLYVTNLYDKKLYAIKIDADHNPATKPTAADVTSYNIPDPGCSTAQPTTMHIGMNDATITGGTDGKVWQPRAYQIGGSLSSTTNAVDVSGAGTAPESLYQHFLDYATDIQVPISNGIYTVKLHYADFWGSAGAGGRVFNVSLEGTVVEPNFNIFDEVGNAKALVKTYTTTVNDGLLNIQFEAVNQQAVLSGFEIIGQTPVAAGEWRPFGLGMKGDSVFVGGVCDASGSQNHTDLKASVYKLTPSVNSTFTPVLNATLDYNKGYAYGACAGRYGWLGWLPNDVYPAKCDGTLNAYPQPMLTDINFANDDSMILGFRDRFGDQSGTSNYTLTGTSTVDGSTAGDVLRAAYVNGNYVLENNGIVGSLSSAGANNNQGPGGGEFYYEDNFATGHLETGLGALATYLPLNQTLYPRIDMDGMKQGGIGWLNNDTGAQNKYYVTYGQVSDSSLMGKAAGMGDLEMATPPAPTEIGNRVWLDTNKNGIQDADETGIDNVTVTLDCGTGQTASTTTSNGGNYLFSNALGGNATFMQPPMSCTVKIDPKQAVLNTYQLAKQDADNNTDNNALTDLRDSDAALVSEQASITVNLAYAGANNHSLDFGFAEAPKIDLQLTKAVNPNVVTPGAVLTYTLTLSNDGVDTATNIEVKDVLPARLSYQSDSGAGSYNATTGIWTVGTVGAGKSTSLTINAVAN